MSKHPFVSADKISRTYQFGDEVSRQITALEAAGVRVTFSHRTAHTICSIAAPDRPAVRASATSGPGQAFRSAYAKFQAVQP